MKMFRHTRRSVILFFLLAPLTLFIYDIVVLTHVGKDVNRINENKPGYRKSMNFVAVFFLGFITLGIVPIVWMTRVANRIGVAAVAHKVIRPHISGAGFFFLFFFFAWTVICPIIGMTKFLHTLNKTEQAINAEIDLQAQQEAEATIIEAPALEAKAEETATQPEKPEEVATEANPEPEVVEEAAPEEAPEPKEEKPLPFEHVTELPPEEIKKDDPRSEIASVYHVAEREEIRKWRVRIPGSDNAVKVFDTREEALAYAKGLAARKHATVRVKRS